MEKITSFKKLCIFLFSLCILIILIITLKNSYLKYKEKELIERVSTKLEEVSNENINQSQAQEIKIGDEIGIIIIPSIEVKASIVEGTNQEILKYAVGHFENTQIWDGNVALASHNRGSYAHYFSRINELKSGEEIIYITNMGERRYKVTENRIIYETNVEILKNTEDNTITLITCVTGQKDKRQYIKGIEIK